MSSWQVLQVSEPTYSDASVERWYSLACFAELAALPFCACAHPGSLAASTKNAPAKAIIARSECLGRTNRRIRVPSTLWFPKQIYRQQRKLLFRSLGKAVTVVTSKCVHRHTEGGENTLVA